MDKRYKELLRQQEIKKKQVKERRREPVPSRLRVRLQAERRLSAVPTGNAYGY